MSNSRRAARELALQLLYELEFNPKSPVAAAEEFHTHFTPGQHVPPFTVELVQGVLDHREEIDTLIAAHSENWKLERMQVIDRNALRLGTYEILYLPQIPAAVTLDELIDIVRSFGSQESASFLNAVLDKIRAEKKKT